MKRRGHVQMQARAQNRRTAPAVAMAAQRKLVSINTWCRQALLAALEREGGELENDR
jgi:hypothetical protein